MGIMRAPYLPALQKVTKDRQVIYVAWPILGWNIFEKPYQGHVGTQEHQVENEVNSVELGMIHGMQVPSFEIAST